MKRRRNTVRVSAGTSAPRLVPMPPYLNSRGQACLTWHEAAKLAGVDRHTILRHIRAGHLPSERACWESHTGSYPILIPRGALLAWMRDRETASRETQ